MRSRTDADSTTATENQALGFMELCLRLSVIPLTVASLWVMATDVQVSDDYGEVKYSDISGFKYLISVDAISAAFSVAALFFSSFKSFTKDCVLYISDQAIAYLMVTSGSAVGEVLYLAHKGDRKVSWSKACNYYGKFCNRAELSLLLHFIALLCFVALALISAFKVYSMFEAPSNPSKDAVEQLE